MHLACTNSPCLHESEKLYVYALLLCYCDNIIPEGYLCCNNVLFHFRSMYMLCCYVTAIT